MTSLLLHQTRRGSERSLGGLFITFNLHIVLKLKKLQKYHFLGQATDTYLFTKMVVGLKVSFFEAF